MSAPKLTIVVPVYNEAKNLPVLYDRICSAMADQGADWEWVAVDDHSADESFAVLRELAARDPRIRAIRLARNCGSHTAIACGIEHAAGDCAVVLAADLQDPPETIPELMALWAKGAHVVWAVRGKREGESASTLGFARLYYWLMRHVAGISEMPASGADFVLIDRRVIDGVKRFRESNLSIMALMMWMGYRQATLTYTKRARLHGSSGWNLEKKFKLVIDSITAFTYLPIRMMSYLGFLVAFAGFLYAAFVIVLAVRGFQPQGWSSLMVVVLILSGLQMIMIGVIGEYLWRALDASRRRPLYLIEDTVGMPYKASEDL